MGGAEGAGVFGRGWEMNVCREVDRWRTGEGGEGGALR